MGFIGTSEDSQFSGIRLKSITVLWIGAGVACAPKNLVSLVHLKSAMF